MTNTNCFLCFEAISENYVNVHPSAKFAHVCHQQCFREFRTQTSNSPVVCPLCRAPVTYLEDEVSDIFPQPKSYKDWMTLIKYFRKKDILPEEILIFFFGDFSIYNLPARKSKAARVIQKFVIDAMNDFSIYPSDTVIGWNAFARFISFYDMVYLAGLAFILGGNFSRSVSFFLSSPRIFRHFDYYMPTKLPDPNCFFYARNSKPASLTIKIIYKKRDRFPDNRWQLQLLEESLQYKWEEDWCQWVEIVHAEDNIPFSKFRNCIIMACVFDFVEVIKWVMTKFSLTEKTIHKYFLLAKSLGSCKIEAFLQPRIPMERKCIKENIRPLITPLQNFKKNFGTRCPAPVSEIFDKMPHIEVLNPAQKWLPRLWYNLLINPDIDW